MHKFVVCAYKSQDFAQSQKFFTLSHNREIVTFRKWLLVMWDIPPPLLVMLNPHHPALYLLC